MLKVAIDGKRFFLNTSGLGRYSRTLVSGLLNLEDADDLDLLLLQPKGELRFSPPEHKRLSVIQAQYKLPGDLGNALWRFLSLPRWLTDHQVQCFHGPSHVIPTTLKCPAVVTMFDLIFLRFPSYFPLWDRAYYRIAFRKAAERADRIISISEATKADLINFFGVPEQKITVIYPAFDTVFSAVDESSMADTAQRFKLPESFIVYVGTIEPRKNILRLAQAFDRLVSRRKDLSDLQLLIVGQKGWFFDDILSGIDRLPSKNRIVFTGPAFGKDLASIYKLASVMAYPSLFEGFGYPVLEAMSVGTPVLTSAVSSMPEAAGNAGLLVNPTQVDEIEAGLERLLDNTDVRQQLIERGFRQAAIFSPETMARKTLRVYRSLA